MTSVLHERDGIAARSVRLLDVAQTPEAPETRVGKLRLVLLLCVDSCVASALRHVILHVSS